jgi:hypothetical protein
MFDATRLTMQQVRACCREGKLNFRNVEMKKTLIILAMVSVISVTAMANPVCPTPGDLCIDFRDAPWEKANGEEDFKEGSVTATALPPGCVTLSQDSTDGLGIDSGWLDGFLGTDDEINFIEILDIGFDTSKGLTGFWISDLYNACIFPDDGWASVNDGEKILFSSSDACDDGFLYVSFDEVIMADSVQFGASCIGDSFSVVGFTCVPAPGAILLGSLGVSFVGYLRRRHAM